MAKAKTKKKSTSREGSSYAANISVRADLDDSERVANYVTELHINICEEWFDEDTQDVGAEVIGTGKGFLIHVGRAIDDNICIVEECDYDSDAYNYCSAVIAPKTNSWRDEIQLQFNDDFLNADLLVLTTMKIEKEHRGQNLGLMALLRMMQWFGNSCGITLVKPWPLQYTPDEFRELEEHGVTSQGWTRKDRNRDFKKIRSYWSKIGFERLGKSNYFAFPHCRPLPQIQAFL